MKKPLLLVLIFACFVKLGSSQDLNPNLKELYLDGEYFFLYEEYEEALYSFNTIYKRGGANNANINYRIGQCYLNIPGEKYRAIPFLEKAVKNMSDKYVEGSFREQNAPYEAQFYLGNAYRITNRLDEAIAAYNKYKELVGNKNELAIKLANKEIDACKMAEEFMRKPVPFNKQLLGRPVNTSSRDYFPVLSVEESMLVYNSAQKFYQALFFCRKVSNKWTAPVNITPHVQSDGNQFASSLSFNGKELYLRMEEKDDANIMVSEYVNGKWTQSRPLNKNINSKYWEGNACVSKDGLSLYFSTNKKGGSGALDLYVSKRKPDGDWEPAVSLGSTINTEFNEDAPFISEDGKKLYFISQGHTTIGGYDVFCSTLNDDGTWGVPVNLGYPVNTTDDDMSFTPLQDGKSGYLALYTQDGLGKQDLFKISFVEADTVKKSEEVKSGIISPDAVAERALSADMQKSTVQSESQNNYVDGPIDRAIFFDFDSYVLSEKAKRQLDHLSALKKAIPEIKIELTGNTDSKGSDSYNQRLSGLRAKAAKDYLIAKGVPDADITIKALGKKNYIAINSNPDGSDNPMGRLYNRRVEVKVIGTDSAPIAEVSIPDDLKISN